MSEPPNLRWSYLVRHEPVKARAEIARAFKESGGSRTKAARALGLSRSVLYKYLTLLKGEK